MSLLTKICESNNRKCSCFFDGTWGSCCEAHDTECINTESEDELEIAHLNFYNCLQLHMWKPFAWIMYQVVRRTTKRYLEEFK